MGHCVLLIANYWFLKNSNHDSRTQLSFLILLPPAVRDLLSESVCFTWWQIMELSQLQAYNNFMKFSRKWEFQVDGVNFIFSLQKIRNFWYKASFEFFCQFLWIYNYFALKIMFFLVTACVKDPHKRIFVEDFCCLHRVFLRP